MKTFVNVVCNKFEPSRYFYPAVILFCIFFFKPTMSSAQIDIYVSPPTNFPLRTGAGSKYPIAHSSISSGTSVEIISVNNDKLWSKIITSDERTGWIKSKYLSKSKPLKPELQLAERRIEVLNEENDKLRRQVNTLKTERKNLSVMVSSTEKEYIVASEELAGLRQISKNSVELDELNKELMEQKENLLAEVATLDSENVRLNDKLKDQSFIQGAFAVLLGVMICIIVPRFTPSSRRKSGWV